MNEIIKVENVYKDFKLGEIDVNVLRGIDLSIFKGEFVSIMGPSGSGKSTLLYLIGGLDKPTSGSIYVNGVNLSEQNDREESIMRRQQMVFIFQFYNLVPNLNVEENITLPIILDGKRVKDYRKQLDEILEIVGLSDRRKHTPRELSGGQQQRVAIARSLINDPEIILADEPIGSLDSKTGNEIMNLFKKINKEKGKTIIQVTHSEEAAKFGQRTIFIKDGIITN